MTLRGLIQVSRHRGDPSWTHILSIVLGRLSRCLRQLKARSESRARLDLELSLHALAMREALQEAEEKVRVEIALRIEAERNARREAEARLEIERVKRREAERRAEWFSGSARSADPETIAKAHCEMILRVKAEQRAVAGVGLPKD